MSNEIPKSAEEPADAAPAVAEDAAPAVARRFRRYAPASTLSPEQCRRQTDVLRAACEHLAPPGAAIAFLNAYDETLGGSPLQVALESDEGLFRVENHLAAASKKRA